jgi:hypothetical protein
MCDYDKFLSFYGNNKSQSTCHGSGSLGDSYVCPSPTIGGKGVKPSQPACGVPTPNMGRLSYCAKAQVGGGSTEGMIFTATGQLDKKKRGCGCQKGGSHHGNGKRQGCKCSKCKCSKCKCSNTKHGHDKSPCGDHDPSSTCNWKSSSYRDYKHNRVTPITGYFLDVAAAPIGNRPVHSRHNNMEPNVPAADNGNMLDRKFDCQQPFWCEKCM